MNRQYGILGMAVVMTIVSPCSAWANSFSPPYLAQVTTITDQLDETSLQLEDGSYVNLHPFEGRVGESLIIDLVSSDFDAYLMLLSPEGEKIAQDDDGGGGTQARITLTLPTTGTYQIVANSYNAGATGQYTLTWQPTTAATVDQNAALQRAATLGQQAVETYEAGRYAEAAALAESALAIRREQLGERHPTVAISLNNLALIYQNQGRYGEAEPLFQTALAINREHFGERHPNVTTNLNNLAGLYRIQGRYGEAEPLLQEALEIDRAYFGDGHPELASSMNSLALLYQTQGHYRQAEPLLQEAVAIVREHLGERHPHVAIALNNLAELYREQGRYDEAAPLYQEALSIDREVLGDQHPKLAVDLSNLALLYQAQGRYREAEPLVQEALAIDRASLGEEHPNVATDLIILAGLYKAQGRYDEAEPLYQSALGMLRSHFGGQHPDVATGLNNLAGLYNLQGRYDEMEPLLQEALAIYRTHLGDRHPSIAASLNNLAELYRSQGRYDDAAPLHQTALDIRREYLGNTHPDVAQSLNNLASLAIDQGRFDDAATLYQTALEIRQQKFGDRHPDVADSLNNLAITYYLQGRYDEVEPLLTDAIAIYREALGDNHPSVANSLNNLAILYRQLNRYDDAEKLLQEVLKMYRQTIGDRSPKVAISLNNLAELYRTQGQIEPAISALQASLNLEERNLNLNLIALTDTQRQAYTATILSSTYEAISLNLQSAPESAPATQLALTTLLRRKGRILDVGSRNLQQLRQNLTPEDQATLDQLATVQRQLANLTFNPPPDLTPAQYRSETERLDAEASQLEASLARRSTLFQAESEPIEIATVQARIPAGGVLIEYIRYRPRDPAQSAQPLGSDRYAAYLLFPDGRTQAIDLGAADTIDTAVQAFTDLLQDPKTQFSLAEGNRQQSPQASEQIATQISALIFDPIAPYLQDTDHLLISPDSQLNRIPFEALPTPHPTPPKEGSDTYLVQRYQISYLNTGRDLVKFGLVPPSNRPAVILANPSYDAASVTPLPMGDNPSHSLRSTDFSQIQVGPLPGTASEASAIAALLPQAITLTEGQATENRLKTNPSPSILHIATHGFFLADTPQSPGDRSISVEPVEGGLAFSNQLPTPPRKLRENPLLRSGLALAGFNSRSSGSEDGVLTALEASTLNLYGTQLVVLSACETGLGDITNGEGVYGLRRAFALAGAETQVMSLWQVSDYGTQSLMARYYANLVQGMGRSEALRAVQLEMIQSGGQYSHPYYWAAFILTGNWQPLNSGS